jgi:hypothetical protein
MWDKLSLKTRIATIICLLMAVSLIGGGAMIWYTYRVEKMLNTIVDKHIATYQSAAALEIAMVNQKGLVSYYFIDKEDRKSVV